jgi:transposase
MNPETLHPPTPSRERERLEIFRTLRSEIRGSTEYLLTGVDVAKQTHHAFFGTPAGETLRKHFVFGNHRAGFEGLLSLAGDLQLRQQLPQRVFGLEPTGVYHKPLLEYLIGEGEQAVLVSNVAVARNRELLDGRWDKNDIVDPANVADLVGQARCLFPDDPELGLRELRNLVRARIRMKKLEHALRMQIRNHLVAQFFPELECAYPKGGSDTMVLAVIRHCWEPREIAQLDFDAFWNRVAAPRWGKRQEPRLRAVWQAAQVSIGCTMDDAIRWEAPRLVDRLEHLREELRELGGRLREAAQAQPGYPSVISIPGVGPVLGAMILAAIGDPHRFDHPRQVLRLAGLDLCARRSGKTSDRAVAKISKQGKGALRYALVQASIVAARSHPVTRAYFTKLLKGREQERGIRLKRHVKMASKLLVVAWTLMKKGETFDPETFMS